MSSSTSSLSRIIPLIDTATTFGYAMPQGKPDVKNHPLTPENEHSRPLIEQKPQKGSTCFYSALNILRPRIGPNPSPQYQDARAVEKLYSNFRNEVANAKITDVPHFFTLFRSMTSALDNDLSLVSCLNNKDLIDIGLKFTGCEAKNDRQRIFHLKATELFEQFCKQTQHNNLFTFISCATKGKIVKASNAFLTALIKDPKTTYEKNKMDDFRDALVLRPHQDINPEDPEIKQIIMKSFEPFEVAKEKIEHIFSMANKEAAKALGFRFAPWTPAQSVVDLQKCLKTYGPLLIKGKFGQSNYSVDPKPKTTIGGIPVFGWAPQDRITASKEIEGVGIANHVVVIIGAATGGLKGGFVYYVDPIDGSRPAQPDRPNTQKIYIISYENLITHINSDSSNANYAETLEMGGPLLSSYALLPRYTLYHPKNASICQTI